MVPFSLIWHEWFHHMSVLGIARLHFDLFFLFLFVDFCDDVRIGWCRDGGYWSSINLWISTCWDYQLVLYWCWSSWPKNIVEACLTIRYLCFYGVDFLDTLPLIHYIWGCSIRGVVLFATSTSCDCLLKKEMRTTLTKADLIGG